MYPIPMNDVVSNLMALQMSGGGTYANEPKIITSNGEYEPNEGVRWDKVTVDVPLGASIGEAITKLPIVWGGVMGTDTSADGYHYLIHLGDLGFGTNAYVYPTPNVNPNPTAYEYDISETNVQLQGFFAIYTNSDSKLVVAKALTNWGYKVIDQYSTRYTEIPPTEQTGPVTIPIERFHYYHVDRVATWVTGVNERLIPSGNGLQNSYEYVISYRYKERYTYYAAYIYNDEKTKLIGLAQPDTIESQGERENYGSNTINIISDNSVMYSYTPLTPIEYARHMAEIKRRVAPITWTP